MNTRKITFETDVNRLLALREDLCRLDINKSVIPKETEHEEGIMDEVRELLDVIIQAERKDLRASEDQVDYSETIIREVHDGRTGTRRKIIYI